LKNLRFNIGRIVGNSDLLFPLLYLSKSRKNGIIRKDSDICIEGFQRSGNTFFHFSFMRLNRQANIAHHLHASAQVIKAIQQGTPTIVLIRNPLEAVASLMVKDLNLTVESGLKSYMDFYKNLMPHRSKFVVGKFEEVIDQPGLLVKQINEQFKQEFQYEILNDNKRANLKEQIKKKNLRNKITAGWERSSIPNEQKEAAKQVVKKQITDNHFYKKALAVYEEFLLV